MALRRVCALGIAVQPGSFLPQVGEIALAFAEQRHALVDHLLGATDPRLGCAQLLLQPASSVSAAANCRSRSPSVAMRSLKVALA